MKAAHGRKKKNNKITKQKKKKNSSPKKFTKKITIFATILLKIPF